MAPNDTGGLSIIDRFEGGFGWLAQPEETMGRASHAVESDGGLWILDPVDAEGLDEALAEYADPAGVVVLLDRHTRDASAVAERHDVPVYVPEWMSGVVGDIDGPTQRFGVTLASFEVGRLINNALWQEATLFDGETLVVPESLGTVSYFRAPGEALGVHPMLRLKPPKSLRNHTPERLLVGHGEGIFGNVPGAIDQAISRSRRTAVPLYLKSVAEILGVR